jgi:hypothetical protein
MSTPTNNKEKVQCSCNPGFEGNPYLSGICQGNSWLHFLLYRFFRHGLPLYGLLINSVVYPGVTEGG